MDARFQRPQIFKPETAPADPRIGHLLGVRLEAGEEPWAVIVGFPSDEGVRRNDGRVGAAGGPAEIRRWFHRFTPCAPCPDEFEALIGRTLDLGDLEVSGDVERDQESLGAALGPYIERGVFAVVLGGGHETAFGHFLGWVAAGREVSILNWDSDVDVRELKDGKAHSGSPFRQALLHGSGLCRAYRVAGLLPYSAAAAHLKFVREHGGEYTWGFDLDRGVVDELYGELAEPAMVTFDLDGVDQAFAPGVSAPATGGISAELWLYAAYAAGRCPAVGSCDIVELSPRYDRDGQTAKLAAFGLWQILRGVSERQVRQVRQVIGNR